MWQTSKTKDTIAHSHSIRIIRLIRQIILTRLGIDSRFSDEVCEEVIEQLKPENLPKQYFFRTEDAISTLDFDRVKRQVVG